eukprot:425311-Amphidinium_carterae.2
MVWLDCQLLDRWRTECTRCGMPAGTPCKASTESRQHQLQLNLMIKHVSLPETAPQTPPHESLDRLSDRWVYCSAFSSYPSLRLRSLTALNHAKIARKQNPISILLHGYSSCPCSTATSVAHTGSVKSHRAPCQQEDLGRMLSHDLHVSVTYMFWF